MGMRGRNMRGGCRISSFRYVYSSLFLLLSEGGWFSFRLMCDGFIVPLLRNLPFWTKSARMRSWEGKELGVKRFEGEKAGEGREGS